MRQRLWRWWPWRRAAHRVQALTVEVSQETTVDLLVEIYDRSERDGWTDEAMGYVIAQGYRTPAMVLWGIKGTPPLGLN